MNPLALTVFLVCAIALLIVPRKWAPAALLAGSLYVTLGQKIEIASISLPIYRLMLLVGIVRVVIRGERLTGGINWIDKLMIGWGAWSIFASIFHNQATYGTIYACGAVFNTALIYFLIRIWWMDLDELREVILIIGFLLVPIALEMLMEKATGKNFFSFLGGVPEDVAVREGKRRAQGPFLHAILAGTVGATCIPLLIGVFSRYRVGAIVGIAAGLVMTFASASSGPVMSLMAGVGALMLWPIRQHLHKFRIAGVILYLVLMVTMAQPPYYLIARIDISGGSTGWHRAFLIEQTFHYFSEWWLFGTDVTRHWMPMQGIAQDPNHTDITNYYISFGVMGGLLSMLALIAMLLVAFSWVGKILDSWGESQPERSFMIWCFGSAMFAHAATSISVAYFDQSMMFFWLTLAVISSVYSIVLSNPDHTFDEEDAGKHAENPVEDTTEGNAEWRRRLRDHMLEEGRRLADGLK